jgi:transglutaminase-like putative cysteine protease
MTLASETMAREASARARHPHYTLAVVALLAAAAVNWQHLAWWCLPLLALASGWRALATLRGHALPGRWARVGLALIITTGVLLSYRTLNGLTAGATLLAAMTAAKLFEARAPRDWYVIIAATLFLLLAACLDRQELWRLPAYALCLWLDAAALRGLSGGVVPPAATLLRESGRALLYAVPLAIVLFLFFPRLPGAFWTLPDADTAITGLGEEMSPGDIGRLVESDQPALRVRFEGALPPPVERYWRGLVLRDFDGRTWRRHRDAERGIDVDFSGPEYRYTETLEPNSHGAVPALELARPPPAAAASYGADLQLSARLPHGSAQVYELSSYPQAVNRTPLDAAARAIDLALPPGRNPRTDTLARQLRATSADDAAYVAAVLAFFRNGGFEYTLEPQRLGRDAVDELLFSTRHGFCGHYASAFVVLMRSAGIPARVVTGYQGGEWNPIGRYLIVRQSAAHAWAEAWLPVRGWVRVDPTAVVAPERLDREYLQFAGDSLLNGPGASANGWFATALQAFDAAGAWWQDQVVGFDLRRQLALAGRLHFGDRDWQSLAIALAAGMITWLAWIGWTLRRITLAARLDALARAWLGVEQALARRVGPRAAHEGVLAWCERLASADARTAPVLPLARRYAQLRFGPPQDEAQLHAFVAAARAYQREERRRSRRTGKG